VRIQKNAITRAKEIGQQILKEQQMEEEND
jgi:hypothetical protein